jgi:hypothetical protein
MTKANTESWILQDNQIEGTKLYHPVEQPIGASLARLLSLLR